jgi:hypothetical protein
MTDKESQALLESIQHWKENVALQRANKQMKLGSENCACCQLQVTRQYRMSPGDFECLHHTGSCVIADYTNRESCEGTPYYHVVHGVVSPQAMVDWLERLYGFLTGEEMIGPDVWEGD